MGSAAVNPQGDVEAEVGTPSETNILESLEEEEVLYMIVQVFTAVMVVEKKKNCLISRRCSKNSKKGSVL